MSYHMPKPPPQRRRKRPAPAPAAYPIIPLTPLSAAVGIQPAPPPPAVTKRELMIAVVVIVMLVAFMYWMNQQDSPRPVERNRSRVKKQSTKEMARNLYKRLENRGGVNDTTMRSLRALGAERSKD